MIKKAQAILAMVLLCSVVSGQSGSQQASKKGDDEPIVRISTELVQVDVVVTDKDGKVVKGLTSDDFEISEKGKKQQISFFEYIDAVKMLPQGGRDPRVEPETGGVGEREVRRILAFVIDDLTIRMDDLAYIRQLLTNFVDNLMQPTDLVAVVRTIGGRGLLQQFTGDKALLRRAIAALTPRTHPTAAFGNPDAPRFTNRPSASPGGAVDVAGVSEAASAEAETVDISSAADETNKALRAYMTLGTASFVIDSMKQLPGRKSLIVISGGLPLLSAQPGTGGAINISNFLNSLTDQATRAGVVIHTMDIRGLQAMAGVAGFEDRPARSALASSPEDLTGNPSTFSNPTGTTRTGTFGRSVDEAMLSTKNPFDVLEGHQGLRMLASITGGITVLERNNFNQGLENILGTSEGYYLLAYSPQDTKFEGDFRRLDVKVKGRDYKVHHRRGYLAREDQQAVAPADRKEQLLTAIKSPLARRDVNIDAVLLYKPLPPQQGGVDIHVVIDPRQLQLNQDAGGKRQTSFDVAGFIFDELGKLRGGFDETINLNITDEELSRAMAGGLSYSANTTLPVGIYQIRLAVRDTKSGAVGTLSRYLEVPDLSKGRLTASSLLLGAVSPGDVRAGNPAPVTANRQVPRTQDLRYAVFIHNAKQRNGKHNVKTQLMISFNGQVIFKEPEEEASMTGTDPSQLIKIGQLGLSGVKPGRYTLTLVITDENADKKSQTITRNMDFIVVN